MLTPSNRTITIASGGTALVGRTTTIPAPGVGGGGSTAAWALGAVVDKAMYIPNTTPALGGSPGTFSGWTSRGTEIIIGLASGHAAGYDNSVNSIQLSIDAPAWVQRMAPSTSTSADTPYYPDGNPAGRHTYEMMQYVPALDMPVWGGVRFTNPNASQFLNADAFDLSNNTWKAPGYISNVPSGVGTGGAGVVDYDGKFHIGGFGAYLDTATRQWVTGTVTGYNGYTGYGYARHPWTTDVVGRKVFNIIFGDGEGFNPELGVRASVMRNNLIYGVSIAPGAALTQFTNDQPKYTAMTFDSINGWFLLYDLGHNRFYKIVVANDNTATMTFYIPDLASVTMLVGEDLNPRMTYFAPLKGIVIGQRTGNLIFIKTSV